jgi:hypothetical protein
VSLETYHSCTFSEKRAVLRTFWGVTADPSDKINAAAREYGPYALAMVAVIAAELTVITAVLIAVGSAWLWAAAAATVMALLSLRRTWTCHRASGPTATH